MRFHLALLGVLTVGGFLAGTSQTIAADTSSAAPISLAGLSTSDSSTPFRHATLRLGEDQQLVQMVNYPGRYRWYRGRWWYPRRTGGWYYWSGGRWIVHRPYYASYRYPGYYVPRYRTYYAPRYYYPRYGAYRYHRYGSGYPYRYYGGYPYGYRRSGISIGIGF